MDPDYDKAKLICDERNQDHMANSVGIGAIVVGIPGGAPGAAAGAAGGMLYSFGTANSRHRDCMSGQGYDYIDDNESGDVKFYNENDKNIYLWDFTWFLRSRHYGLRRPYSSNN